MPQVCESLHLPVQSGSNTMLKAMARNYTREQYVDLVKKMREAMPDMTLSTDIIVGFPGETEDDFQQTLSLIEELQFDWGFIFKYSTREGTPAASLECHPENVDRRAAPALSRTGRSDRVGKSDRSWSALSGCAGGRGQLRPDADQLQSSC